MKSSNRCYHDFNPEGNQIPLKGYILMLRYALFFKKKFLAKTFLKRYHTCLNVKIEFLSTVNIPGKNMHVYPLKRGGILRHKPGPQSLTVAGTQILPSMYKNQLEQDHISHMIQLL